MAAEEPTSPRKLIRQIAVLVCLIAIVLFVLLQQEDSDEILSAVKSASLPLVCCGVVLAIGYVLAVGTNLFIILRAFGYEVRFPRALYYAFVGFFFSAITPAASGGQPMQLYTMCRDHIKISHATLTLIMELTSFQICVFVFECVAFILASRGALLLQWYMMLLAVLGFILNLAFLALLFTAMFSRKLIFHLVSLARKIILKLPRVPQERKKHWVDELDFGLDEFHACALAIRRHKPTVVKVLCVSTAEVLCSFSIPFVVYLSLAQNGATYGHVMMLQALVFMISSLIPLPGAVGISEFSFIQLFGTVYPAALLTPAVLVSRGISFYFLLLLSAVVIIVCRTVDIFRGRMPVASDGDTENHI